MKIAGNKVKKRDLTTVAGFDVKGKKVDVNLKIEKKRRIIFQNLYNRIRKFVDELMLWCWQQDSSNFIGYYVDCIWLKAYDVNIINKLKEIYKLKIELVDLEVKKNLHNKIVLLEDNGTDQTPYDAQFKNHDFVIYKNLYNFTPELKNINLKIKCNKTM